MSIAIILHVFYLYWEVVCLFCTPYIPLPSCDCYPPPPPPFSSPSPVLSYLAMFRLEELGMDRFKYLVGSQPPVKMLKVTHGACMWGDVPLCQ